MTPDSITHEPEQRTPAPTILIVEDDLAIGFVLAQVLKEEIGARVLFATDGWQALQMLQVLRPALCLLDYWLPQINGLELVAHLRASRGGERLPIVLMSATLPTEALEAYGLVGLAKPFELEALIELVHALLAQATGDPMP